MTRPLLCYQIVVDRTERPGKCTILPLDGRSDVDLRRVGTGGRMLPAFSGGLLLHPEGEPLTDLPPDVRAAITTLCLIDCNWRRLPGLLARVPTPLPRLVRIPDGIRTAYPRRNKDGLDPAAGLATIEALYAAALCLGVRDETLLSRYHFAPEFLALNNSRLAGLAAADAGDPSR